MTLKTFEQLMELARVNDPGDSHSVDNRSTQYLYNMKQHDVQREHHMGKWRALEHLDPKTAKEHRKLADLHAQSSAGYGKLSNIYFKKATDDWGLTGKRK